GAQNPNSMKIRFHTQTGGVTLQAQQPEVNIIRVALQGFAAVCGGTQSLHTNDFVESLTDEIEARAKELMGRVAELGGSVEALEFMQREIEESAHSYHERYR